MTDKPYEVPPGSPPEMRLASELITNIAPAFNEWLSKTVVRRDPANKVLEAMCIAFAMELSMVIELAANPESREKIAANVARNIHQRLFHNIRMQLNDLPSTTEGPNGSHN